MTQTPTGEPLRVGSRYLLTRDSFFMYDGVENSSRCREIYEGEEFSVLGVCRATNNGKEYEYLNYKVIIRSGYVGYVGYPIVDACVEIA